MSETETSVLLAVADDVATVTLNRPDLHNAFDERLIAQLTDLLGQVDTDPAVRVMVLAAAGRSFCAGADLNWMRRMALYSEDENVADARRLAAMLKALDRLSKPTVAKVQGSVFAGGIGLVGACDIVVAAEIAEFAVSEVRLGIIPSTISPYLVRAVGLRAARRLVLTGERISAAEAMRLGLAHHVVAPDALDAAVDAQVAMLKRNGPAAMAAGKELLRRVGDSALDDALIEITARSIAAARASPEGREGIAAFLEKRKPGWVA